MLTFVGEVRGLFCLGVMSSVIMAQSEIWTLEGNAGEGFGQDIVSVGDLDGDGIEDVAIGLPGIDKVRLRSGADGSALLSLGGQAGSRFGNHVAALGDVDLDGVPDIGVCAPQLFFGLGVFSVRSGADGTVLFNGGGNANAVGLASTGVGDIDLDGAADYAYSRVVPGVSGSLDEPRGVSVVSGATGAGLVDIINLGGQAYDPLLMAGGRDVNGDGHPDLVVDDDDDDRLLLFDGAGLAAGSTAGALSWIYGFGVSAPVDGLALLDSVDGDGLADIAVSSQGQLRFLSGISAGSQLAPVGPILGAEGKLGISYRGEVASIGDVDGDGVGDLIARHGFDFEGVSVLSGADGVPLLTVLDQDAGRRVAGAGDLDGDGRADVLVSDGVSIFSAAAGRVQALSTRAGRVEPFGFAHHPSFVFASPELSALGSSVPGGELTLRGWSDDADAGFLLFGPTSSALPLPAGGFVYVAPLVFLTSVSLPEGLGFGNFGQWSLPIPTDAAGLRFGMQLALPP